MEIILLVIVVALGSVVLWVTDVVTAGQRDREMTGTKAARD